MHIGKCKITRARILTSEDIAREIREHEKDKQDAEEAKRKRKEERAKKRLFNEIQKVSKEEERIKRQKCAKEKQHEILNAKAIQEKNRRAKKCIKHFQAWQQLLMKCKNFAAFVQCSREALSEVSDNEPVIVLPTCHVADEVSSDLLCDMIEYSDLRPMQIPAYGDCLPSTTSCYRHRNADHHVEARVRITMELGVHEDLYLDDNFLAKGISDCTSRSTTCHVF